MIWAIFVTLLITVVMVTYGIVIRLSRKRTRQRYHSKPIGEIVEAKVFARKLMVLFLCFAFLGPVPLSFIIARFAEGRVRTVIIGLTIILIISSIMSAIYWWTVEGVTRSLFEEQSSGCSDNPDDAHEKSL
jgi:drug/metabolite transporter (DMT)-like permease